jgi:Transposase DDE domain group 1
MSHPLLVCDGDTGQLITAVLRPGTCHASRGAVAVLNRLVRHIGPRWPQVTIEFRADAGFAVPALYDYDYLEEQHIPYPIGVVSNARLAALAGSRGEEAKRQRAATGAQVRLLAEGPYQAASWSHERRVV